MALEEEADPGIPEWVVTFGDMMSLLLTFFIMLVSMSEMKKDEKYQAMVESIREQFGHEMSPESMVPGESRTRSEVMPNLVSTLGRAKKKGLENGGQEVKAVSGDNEKVQIIRPGDDSAIGGMIYFDEGSTEISEQNKRALMQVIQQVAGKPQKIEIRGHTSRKPVDKNQGHRDFWDLAYERCRSTMRFLVENGIDESRLRLGTAGASEPIYSGDDLDQLFRNSRVQVLMWDERVQDLDGREKTGSEPAEEP